MSKHNEIYIIFLNENGKCYNEFSFHKLIYKVDAISFKTIEIFLQRGQVGGMIIKIHLEEQTAWEQQNFEKKNNLEETSNSKC